MSEDGTAAEGETARLFLALWPDAATAAAIARCRDGWRWSATARPQATARLHLTLHFIGSVARAQLALLEQSLRGVPSERALLVLDHVELWRNGIAALCPAAWPDPMARLHARLGEALAASGRSFDARPLRPHVTLARQASGSTAPSLMEPVRWPVDHHLLVETDRASGDYRRLWRSAGASI